jgi:hypothetical protein
MRDGTLPLAAVAERPMVALSLLGERCAATIDAVGTRLVQSHAFATDAGCETVPSTCTLAGSECTLKALPSTVIAALVLAVPPRWRSPRTTVVAELAMLPGVHSPPPRVLAADAETLPLAPRLPPAPPSGAPSVLSNPSVAMAPLTWMVVQEQRAQGNIDCPRPPVQVAPPSTPVVVGSPALTQFGPASAPPSTKTLSTDIGSWPKSRRTVDPSGARSSALGSGARHPTAKRPQSPTQSDSNARPARARLSTSMKASSSSRA